ncbi:MAG: hypothetical protein H6537_02570 [Bacteroidales bacterium]|nr:hypothetical protein [Bacteroidales bacterium]
MFKSTFFNTEEIELFCKATADENPIHTSNFMHSIGKQVVVPGMFLFSKIINMLFEQTTICFNAFKVLFGNIVEANEEVELGFEACPNNSSIQYLSAINEHDSFAIKNERSSAFVANNVSKPVLNEGVIRKIKFSGKQKEIFSRLIGCTKNALNDFLFAIAYASPVLLKSIHEPLTDIEREINNLIDKTANPGAASPFYQSLEILRSDQSITLPNEGEIDYNIQFEREKYNRTYVANVDCEFDSKTLFQSKYRLIAIPEKLMLRMVKDLKI